MNETRPGLRPPTRPAWHAPPDVLRILWTRPRASVRWLIDHGGLRLSILLVCGASATSAISEGQLIGTFHTFGAWGWVFAIAIEMLAGLVAWLLGAMLLLWIGRALSGAASWKEMLIALAWGHAPIAAALPVALLRAWSRSLGNVTGELLALLLLAVLYFWALATTTMAVAEAHRFSFARAGIAMSILVILASVAVVGIEWLPVH
jgi:hypothetical protein